MKKIILAILFIFLCSVNFERVSASEIDPCITIKLKCDCDGSLHTVIVCEGVDIIAWRDLLCCSQTN